MIQAFKNWAAGLSRPRMGRRMAALFLGITMMGFCVAMLDRLGFGTDPCSTVNLGVSRTIGWSFGTWQLTVNILMLLIVIRYDLGRIGLGTLVNMVGVGYAAEFFMMIFDRIPWLSAMGFGMRLIVFVPTLALLLFSAATYMVCDLGVAPYDAIPQIIAGRTGKAFRLVRTLWDLSMLTIGFLFGATVGPTTFGVAFFLGPLVAYLGRKMEPFFN